MLIKLEKKSPQELVCVRVCLRVHICVCSTGVSESDGLGLKGGEILVVIKNCNSELLSY